MHMPGFTAEFALYESHEGHQGQTVEHGHEQVIPQLRFSCLVRAGKMFLDSVGEGILDQDTCAMFARMSYGVCDMLSGPDD